MLRYSRLLPRPLARFVSHASAQRKPLFDKILIANRGEIACRVMRTAKRLGIQSVAVYSEADRDAMHVAMADEAYCIGPAPSADSYLCMDKIIGVAKRSGAQAIHPGYGFLSENPEFADRISESGLIFIGPPSSAIRAMGSKSASKQIMQKASVPVVPGFHGDNQDAAHLKQEAAGIGYPVLIKAIKGGGGKGMRVVEKPEDFDVMLESSRREARKAFGDDRVLVEKYLVTPRHVEVQVFADQLGNAVYLFERDCSVQRRHQKIIEEAPAPGLSAELRQELGDKAVAAAKAVNYVGAGTVEFIMDNTDNKFYFMEMNTRLQVEHPVTEMVTGTDLVEWQLEVASGNRLPKLQQELELNGHSFEARIYAENPRKKLIHLSTPEPSSSVRVETGVRAGDQVSVFYDPMIAKLVVHAEDRTSALRKLRKALHEYQVAGPTTNIEFLKTLASHPGFIGAELETGFIKKYEADLFPPVQVDGKSLVQAALSVILREQRALNAHQSQDPFSPWALSAAARLNSKLKRSFSFLHDGSDKPIEVVCTYSDSTSNVFDVEVAIENEEKQSFLNVGATLDGEHSTEQTLVMAVDMDERRCRVNAVHDQDQVIVFNELGSVSLTLPPPAFAVSDQSAGSGPASNSVKSPMPCKIAQVMVKPGTPLIILEAMKMEHVMRAPMDGVVERVNFSPGDLVEDSKILVVFQDAPATEQK